MSGNTFGKIFKVTTFGESHGASLGGVIDGLPAGLDIDIEKIQKDLDRRKPSQKSPDGSVNKSVTQRNESDTIQILSGIFEGKSTGCPIGFVIPNSDAHSSDYSDIAEKFRPGHADYTFYEKYGIRDYRGGGRSSGRETACRVAGGAFAKILLEKLFPQFEITASTTEAAGIKAETFDKDEIEKNSLRCADKNAAKKMEERIEEIRSKGDSCGAIVECRIKGIKAGLGEPVFDKLDALLAQAMLSIGAIKGIEFGSGFESAGMLGSEWNDQMKKADSNGQVFKTNHAGGILGGMSNGNEIVFRVAIKPVPSISCEQNTIDKTGNECTMQIKGRHDICLAPRIIPVIEAMASIVLADLALQNLTSKIN
ncbi:MAG: chorismate synthase [Treponemataceae bacterium]|nr:chorismate synthase [Treponemataceae bacterium]